jgi:hypothetical protein
MENLPKPLRQYIKEAEAAGKYLVLLGAEEEFGKHAALVAKLRLEETVMIVPITDLPKNEQDLIEKHTRPAGIEEIMETLPYKITAMPELIEPIVLEDHKPEHLPAPIKVALPEKTYAMHKRKDFNHRRR